MTSTTCLHSEDLLDLVESDPASVITGISPDEIADFRHCVRCAAIGAVLETTGQRFLCIAWSIDGSRIYSPAA